MLLLWISRPSHNGYEHASKGCAHQLYCAATHLGTARQLSRALAVLPSDEPIAHAGHGLYVRSNVMPLGPLCAIGLGAEPSASSRFLA